ncbi:MAG: primosomal protein N' [Bacteroidales bacterium]|nr:primosomal protein N' [Bacteroidales bacterium]
MENFPHFVDVILPLPLPRYFTYSLPEELWESVHVGSRVIVPFGKRKFYTAIAVNIHYSAPEEYETRDVVSVLDHAPIVRQLQIKFWEWLADYYLCSVGDVYKAALPSGLKLESETLLLLNPNAEIEPDSLSPKEILVIDKLPADEKISIIELEKETGLKNLLPVLNGLLEKEILLISEQMKADFRPKLEQYVRLTLQTDEQDRLRTLFDELSKAPKQLNVLLKYLDLSHFLQPKETLREVNRKELLKQADATAAVLKALVDKGIFEAYTKEKTRLSTYRRETVDAMSLNEPQRKAYDEIHAQFSEKETVLLHGVTSSGKTELYIHLIQEQLQQGKQVLYLLPEIALTTQLTDRLQRVFGNRLGIYHSKFSDNERVEIWNNLLQEKGYDVILGVRSSVFLPFRNLGLIIVDEEHENTYKQQDPAPRYHARSAALVLASMHKAKTLLGTATPSIESYHLALQGKFGLVELNERYEGLQLPEIIPVDTKELRRKKRMNGTFSPLLVEKIGEALAKKEQVILFQNRRGFAPMMECKQCAWVPKCKNCDVSLTYHKFQYQLTCHYCGFVQPIPKSCPACGNTSLEMRGFGTEKIEDEIKELFPDVSVGRMDLDTTRTRKSYEQLIRDFEQRKTKILIGTQMVSKGLDFDNVSVVGIISADSMMNFPDFRSHERAYQLMVQVSGRAGRKNKRGTVVLQCSDEAHPVIRQVIASDYKSLYETQLAERQLFRYPPFYRLIYIYLKHRNEPLLIQMADVMAAKLRTIFGERILGPDKPPVARIQNFYIKKIVVKVEQQASLPRVKELLRQVQKEILETEGFKSALVYYDVDPM